MTVRSYNLITIIINVIILFHGQTAEASLEVVDKLLFEIKNKSSQFKISNHEANSNLVLNSKENLIFKPSVFLNANYLNEKSPPRSAFSTSKTETYEYRIGFKKLWEKGINTQLSYGLSDVSTSFFSGNNENYLLPKLQVSLSSNIIQNLVYDRYSHLNEEVKNNTDVININKKLSQKKLLTQALLNYASLLEIGEELTLQIRLCSKTRIQSDKLKRKRARRSISSREYYLSLRETTLCQAVVENLKKRQIEDLKKFETTYNINYQNFNSIKVSDFFEELNQYYKKLKNKPTVLLKVNELDEIRYLNALLATSKNRQQKLEAMMKSNLAVELKTGATGLNDSIKESNEELVELKYPFIYVGLTADLPWEDRVSKVNAIANIYKTKAIEEQSKLSKTQISERFDTLNSTLSKDFKIYKKYLRASKLSRSILNEASKDFTNGKIDFYSLTEFNKRLIQDQKFLSSYRIQLIVRMVEYLDFHNYFNKYF